MSRTMTLCPGALGNKTLLSGWRPMCFSCFSHTCRGIKIKQRVKRMDSEAIHSSHRWRKIGLIDHSPIRPTDEQMLTAPSLNMHSICYTIHAHGEGSCQLLLCLVLSHLICHCWLSKTKPAKTSIKKSKLQFFSRLTSFDGQHSSVSIIRLSQGEGLLRLNSTWQITWEVEEKSK